MTEIEISIKPLRSKNNSSNTKYMISTKFLPNIKRLNALSFTTTYIFSGIEYNKS